MFSAVICNINFILIQNVCLLIKKLNAFGVALVFFFHVV